MFSSIYFGLSFSLIDFKPLEDGRAGLSLRCVYFADWAAILIAVQIFSFYKVLSCKMSYHTVRKILVLFSKWESQGLW